MFKVVHRIIRLLHSIGRIANQEITIADRRNSSTAMVLDKSWQKGPILTNFFFNSILLQTCTPNNESRTLAVCCHDSADLTDTSHRTVST